MGAEGLGVAARVLELLRGLDEAASLSARSSAPPVGKGLGGGASQGLGTGEPRDQVGSWGPSWAPASRLTELHVDGLHARGLLRPLGRAARVLDLRLGDPPAEDGEAVVQVRAKSSCVWRGIGGQRGAKGERWAPRAEEWGWGCVELCV